MSATITPDEPAAPSVPLDPPTGPSSLITEKTAMAISGGLFFSLFVCLAAAIWLKNDSLLNAIGYATINCFIMMTGFWFGSSRGSQTKDAVIAGQLAATSPPPAPIPHP